MKSDNLKPSRHSPRLGGGDYREGLEKRMFMYVLYTLYVVFLVVLYYNSKRQRTLRSARFVYGWQLRKRCPCLLGFDRRNQGVLLLIGSFDISRLGRFENIASVEHFYLERKESRRFDMFVGSNRAWICSKELMKILLTDSSFRIH